MIWLALEFINLVVLFTGVLGYHLRKQKAWVAVGFLFFALQYICESTEILYTGGIPGGFVYLAIIFGPAIGMLFVIEGRKSIIFGIGVSVRCVMLMLESAGKGIAIWYRKGEDIMDIDSAALYTVEMLCFLAVLLGLFFVSKKNTERIRFHVDHLNPLLFIPFFVLYRIFEYSPYIIGGTQADQQFFHGISMVRDGVLVLIFIFAFVLLCMLISQRKELRRMLLLNQKCIAEQTEQYHLMNSSNQALRKFGHDYNEHIAVLQALEGAGDREGISRYIQQLAKIGDKFKLIRTGNIVCDAILNQYAFRCEEEGFTLQVKGSFPAKIAIEETDLCVILSNGIKNAYEATRKCALAQRKLHFEVVNRGNFIYITIWNSAKEAPMIENGFFVTTKADKENHGLGIRNMIEAAEKSGGTVRWEYKNGTVITEIVIREERE